MSHAEKTLDKLLNKIANEQEYQNYEIIINQISSGGANYTSKLYTVIIREPNRDDLHLFAKVVTIGETFRNAAPANLFDTELFVYSELLKTYQLLEEENFVPEDHRLLFTKFYGCDPCKYHETLVLENLIAQGFEPCNRFKSMDWEYAFSAVLELAKLHALSFAYSEKYPAEFEKVLAKIKMEWKDGMLDSMSQSSVDNALMTVKQEYKEILEKFLVNHYIKDLLVKFCAPVCRTVIIHGDYRGSNLLHRVRGDGKYDIKIVDFQTLQGGCPVSDLLYFIFTGSDEQFRAQYFDKLVDHYYTQLSAAMRRLHLNPDKLYPREVFDYEFKEKLPFGLRVAVFTLPIVTVDAENAPTVDENMELASFSLRNTSSIYAERLNGVVNDFVKWGVLK